VQIIPQLDRLRPINGQGLYVQSGKTIFEPPDEGQTQELIHFQARELPEDIRVRAVKIKSNPRYWDDGSGASPKRDQAWDRIVYDFVSLVEENKIQPSDFWLFADQHPLRKQIRWLRREARKRQPQV
jgi:hypothetical protein